MGNSFHMQVYAKPTTKSQRRTHFFFIPFQGASGLFKDLVLKVNTALSELSHKFMDDYPERMVNVLEKWYPKYVILNSMSRMLIYPDGIQYL